MRIKLLLILAFLLQTAGVAVAQNDVFHQLFVEGNECYANVGNKAHLRRIIDSFEDALNTKRAAGQLTNEADDSLTMLRLYKLLGDYHYLNSDDDVKSYAEAENYFKKSLEFAEDPAHSKYQTINHDKFILHQELGQLYYKQGRYQDAYDEMETAFNLASKYFSPYDDEVLDHVSQLAICKARIAKNKDDFEEAIDDIDFVIDKYKNKKSEPYGEALRKKAKILMLQREAGMGGTAGEALKYYKKYFSLKKADALKRLAGMNDEDREQYWMRIRPFIADCYRLEDVDPALLYDLTLFGKAFLLDYSGDAKPCTYQQIQKQMQPYDCAIEFVQYEKNGEKQMGALVLKKKGSPVFVKIGSVEALKKTPLRKGGNVLAAITADNAKLKNNLYTDTTVVSKIWTGELLSAIGNDTKRIYFAPDGIFHQIAIEYMLPKDNVYRLTSTRQILTKSQMKLGGKVLIFSNVDYENAAASSEVTLFHNDQQAYKYLKTLRTRVEYLPGTKDEADSIKMMLEKLNVNAEVVSDSAVTEGYLSRVINGYPVVHLATHGYFVGDMPEGTDLKPATYDESLSQNGLILAGANENLKRDDFNTSDHDGILSAREISEMDLSNVDLIVLSACHSGQGFLTDDGVYGLQRSLKNAGVKGMILSLWSVDDKATSLLMQSFYKYLQTDDVHTAFMKARKDLMNTENVVRVFDVTRLAGAKGTSKFDKPQYYDAFILIDIK